MNTELNPGWQIAEDGLPEILDWNCNIGDRQERKKAARAYQDAYRKVLQLQDAEKRDREALKAARKELSKTYKAWYKLNGGLCRELLAVHAQVERELEA
jgi:hypothetical protein